MEEFIGAIMPAVLTLVTAILGYVSYRVGRLIDVQMEKNNIYDALKANEVIVKASVKYVEQVYKELDGQGKFEKAKEKALKIMAEKGIDIGEDELEALIEQTVLGFKKGMKEDKTIKISTDSLEVPSDAKFVIGVQEGQIEGMEPAIEPVEQEEVGTDDK